MKIAIIGGGPAGMYFAILTKKALPKTEIVIYERNKLDDTFGFGVVFSDETLNEFLHRDTRSYELLKDKFSYWGDLDIVKNSKEKIRIVGNGFCGCSRKTLLQLLAQRCQEEKITILHQNNFDVEKDIQQLSKNNDLVIAADGINSAVRTHFAKEFGTNIEWRSNRFVWLGSNKPLDAFTYYFRQTPQGLFLAHTYQYEKGKSTWVIETTNETWKKTGFEVENEKHTIDKLSTIFATELNKHSFIGNRSFWRQFPIITNKNWYKDNIVLLGDAVATAHFSIGSGTRLAMLEAIALADAVIEQQKNSQSIYAAYEKNFRPKVEAIQHAANVSLEWVEGMNTHIKQDFLTFAFSVMSRSKQVTYENLKRRDQAFTDAIVKNLNQKIKNKNSTQSPAFTPFKIGKLALPNRIVMTAMGQYSAQKGLVNDWHFTHYTNRAIGGTGLIITEMTAPSPDGRISLGCAGIWNEDQTKGWKKITDFIHQHTDTKIALQLGHAGPKGATNLGWEGAFTPLTKNKWKLIAASPTPYTTQSQIPQSASKKQMEQVLQNFAAAAKRADKAGFDMIELHAGHGMLIGSFISPLTNLRKDEYGGSLQNRLQFPLEVIQIIRKNFKKEKPLSVKISATDWAENGLTLQEAITTAKAFKKAGADIIFVSGGGTVSYQQAQTGRMYMVPFSDAIKNEANVPTITVGNIENIDHVNTILLAKRADLVALGRPLLANPYWVKHAEAYEQNHADKIKKGNTNPLQYIRGTQQLYHLQEKNKQEFEKMKRQLKPQAHNK